MTDIQEYPQMLYHPDGRKIVARDEAHHAVLAADGYCALDADNKMPEVESPKTSVDDQKPRRGRPPKVKDGDDNALRS